MFVSCTHLLISEWWVQTSKKILLWWVFSAVCSTQPAVLFFLLYVCLYLSQLPFRQLLLSQSISCHDFTSLYTTSSVLCCPPFHYLPYLFHSPAMHRSSFFRCCCFPPIFIYYSLCGLTNCRDFINLNQLAWEDMTQMGSSAFFFKKKYCHLSQLHRRKRSACVWKKCAM